MYKAFLPENDRVRDIRCVVLAGKNIFFGTNEYKRSKPLHLFLGHVKQLGTDPWLAGQ